MASNSASVVHAEPAGSGFASLSQLTLAEIVRRVDEVQLMLDVGALEQCSKPLTPDSGIGRKVEDDGYAPRQELLDVKRQRFSHSSRASDEILEGSDLSRIQRFEQFILHEKNGVLRSSQFPRVRRFPGGHLPAHEIQRRPPLGHFTPTQGQPPPGDRLPRVATPSRARRGAKCPRHPQASARGWRTSPVQWPSRGTGGAAGGG